VNIPYQFYQLHHDVPITTKLNMIASMQLTRKNVIIIIIIISTSEEGTDLYPHMPILLRAIYCSGVRGPRAGRFVRFWASGEAKFTRMGDSLPGTPINSWAKFDAASFFFFIFGGEIRNRTNKQTNKQTNTQTLTDISTPCLSAWVDNNNNNNTTVRCKHAICMS